MSTPEVAARRRLRAIAIAWMAALAPLAACDDGGEPAALDAGLDAPVVVAPGPVTVRLDVFPPAPAGALAGIAVVFAGPAGAETVVLTDADGRAEAIIAPDTVVYVALEGAPTGGALTEVVAFAGVDPGMTLVVGGSFAFHPPLPSLGTAALTVEADPRTNQVTVALPCGERSTGPLPGFPLALPRCATSAHATLVAVARDGDALLGYGVATDVDLTALSGGALTLTATTPPASATLVYTSVPFDVRTIQATITYAGDVSLEFATRVVAQTESLQFFRVPVAPVGARTTVRTEVTAASVENVAPVWNLRRFAGPRLEVDVDLGATAMQFMRKPSVVAITATGETALAWGYHGGGGRRPDVVVAQGSELLGGRRVYFTVHAPGARTGVTLRYSPYLMSRGLPAAGLQEVVEFHGVALAGADYAAAVREVDAEARRGLDRDDVFAGRDDVWITGARVP